MITDYEIYQLLEENGYEPSEENMILLKEDILRNEIIDIVLDEAWVPKYRIKALINKHMLNPIKLKHDINKQLKNTKKQMNYRNNPYNKQIIKTLKKRVYKTAKSWYDKGVDDDIDIISKAKDDYNNGTAKKEVEGDPAKAALKGAAVENAINNLKFKNKVTVDPSVIHRLGTGLNIPATVLP